MVCPLFKLHVNVTNNSQSLFSPLYFQVVLSIIKLPLWQLTLRDKTLTKYHNQTMSTWDQTVKSTGAWLQHISNIMVNAPRRPPFLTLHHPPTLEASICPNKNVALLKIAHSWIPSHLKFFITLICGM